MVMSWVLVCAVMGGLVGGTGILAIALLLPRKSCPQCKALLPRFRMPGSARKAMLGGWRCPACGANVARDGSLLSGGADDKGT